jgi:electron transfer flavoprotein alpha subunit
VLETFENQQGRRRCTFINPAGLPALIREKRRAGCFPKGPEGRQALKEETAGPRLPEAWVVGGGELEEIASGIAEKTLTLEWMDTRRMAEQIKREKPRVVLWPADWRGRREAARIAALLGAGLCADCISLQTDGRDLFFYRPAWGGNLIGKIRCKTVPAMATVRLRDITEGSLMVSMGMGMRGLEEEVAACARRLDAELGASRPAVDAGMAPYETQVGLTGRMVSPGVYLSLGISGAAAHTCAIEGAGCVIAVNTDGKARIFEYADYGVVAGGREALAVL